MGELKACRWCGWDDELSIVEHFDPDRLCVFCGNCGAAGPSGFSESEAVEQWNDANRPTPAMSMEKAGGG